MHSALKMSTRCYYDILGVQQDATAAAIKKSYHKEALRWHPDKNAGDAEATEMFKQVQEAYGVLSDPQERAYYDDNRDEILMSDDEEERETNEGEAELDTEKWCSRDAFVDFSYAEDGFFSVYANVFHDLNEQEKTAQNGSAYRPGFGSAGSDQIAVTAFYSYWLHFSTCRSDKAFSKHDKWDLCDAPSPLMRRLMQQKNKIFRDKARKMFEGKVRRLAAWVKSHDPRVCGDTGAVDVGDGGSVEEAAEDKGGAQFHCAACNKWYKNAQQLSNHEKSGKHKQTVAKVRKQLAQEGEGLVELEDLGMDEGEQEEQRASQSERGEDARAADAKGETRGGGGAKSNKKKGRRENGQAEEEEEGGDDGDDGFDMAGVSRALPSPADVALQTRQAFESTDEYKKMNKTQRRKALLQWEAENEHIMETLRAAEAEKEPRPETTPREKKPEPKEAKKEKVHGSGAHSREIKTPKKKKAVYGKARAAADEDED